MHLYIALELGDRIQGELVGVSDPIDQVTFTTFQFVLSVCSVNSWWAREFFQGALVVAYGARLVQLYLEADIRRGIEAGDFDVRDITICIEHVAAILVSAIRMQFDNDTDDEATNNACESVLRVLGASRPEAGDTLARYEKRGPVPLFDD